MKLSAKELKMFFIGNMLGDGAINKGAFVTQQVNKDLVEFKQDVINYNLNPKTVKLTERMETIDKKGVNRKTSWELYVSRHEYINKLYIQYYPNKTPYRSGNKTIPSNLKELSPLAYAIWYADDGTTILVGANSKKLSPYGSARSRRVQICTDRYSYDEVLFLESIINKDFKDTTIVFRKKDAYRIQINNKDAQKFMVMVYPYFKKYFPSLLYKMDLGYRNESLNNELYVTEEYKNIYLEMSALNQFIDRLID